MVINRIGNSEVSDQGIMEKIIVDGSFLKGIE